MTNNGIYFVWVITQNFFLISCGVKRFLVRIWKKKTCDEKNDFAGKITMGEKTKRSPFTRSNPRPPSSTCAIYISKIGMAAKQHFLNEDNNKNTGIHFGRACMIVCSDQNWTFLISRLLMLSVYDVQQPPQSQDAEASSETNTEWLSCIPPSYTHPRSEADVH